MAEPTPGPWRVEVNADPLLIVGRGNFPVAEVGSVSRRAPVDEANARLIAAAPELLECLRNLVGLADYSGRLEGYTAALNDARAAIQKAMGGDAK